SSLVGAFFALIPLSAFCEGVKVVEKTDTAGKSIIIENSFYKATLLPSSGGRIASLIMKSTGNDLTGNKVNPGWGLCKDIEISQSYPGEMMDSVYQYEINKVSGGVRAHLVFKEGRSIQLKDMVVHKTFVFNEGSPVIRVDIMVENKGNSTRPFGYRAHNDVQVGGKVDFSDLYFVSGMDGNRGYLYGKYGDYFIADRAHDWAGAVDTLAKEGLIFKCDDGSLDKVYFYHGRRSISNIELYYKYVSINPGKTWATSYYIIPYAGANAMPVFVDSKWLAYAFYEGPLVHVTVQNITSKPLPLHITGARLDAAHKEITEVPSADLAIDGMSSKEVVYRAEGTPGGFKLRISSEGSISSFFLPAKDGSKVIKTSDDPYLQHGLMYINTHLSVLEKKTKLLSTGNRDQTANILAQFREALNASDISVAGIQEINKRLDEANCTINRMLFPKNRYVIWAGCPWTDFTLYDVPGGSEDLKRITVELAKNQCASRSFMLTNTDKRNLVFNISCKPSSKNVSTDTIDVTIREAVSVPLTVAGASKAYIHDALPDISKLNKRNRVVIPAGQTKQIWLTIRGGEHAKPGLYNATVAIAPEESGAPVKKVMLVAEMLPLSIPRIVKPKNFAYCYFTSPETDPYCSMFYDIKEVAVEDMLAHYNNCFSISRFSVPFEMTCASPDADLVLDFKKCDEAVKTYGAGNMMWLLGFKSVDHAVRYITKVNGVRPCPWYDDKTLFTKWLKRWIEHLKYIGVDYDDYMLFITDESTYTDDLLDYVRLIKETDPNVRTLMTSGNYVSLEDTKKMAQYVDVWAINQSADMASENALYLKATDKEVWDYNRPCSDQGQDSYAYR
ncbi:MAG: hypothetical protein PHT33_15970, partial [bacterium]|nr:hypothetical protein [bacterium]